MLLGISGSLREGATNTHLIREAGRFWADGFEEADIRFPLYDNDLEDQSGLPEAVERVVDQIARAEAVVIATPEYNQSLSGVLKNALDWISRSKVKPWADKPVLLMSAAAGRSGGARASYALRLAMTSFRPRLLTREVLVAGARKEFDENGHLTSERYAAQVTESIEALKAEVARAG